MHRVHRYWENGLYNIRDDRYAISLVNFTSKKKADQYWLKAIKDKRDFLRRVYETSV